MPILNPMRRPATLLSTICLLAIASLSGAGGAMARVPQGFVGVMLDGPALSTRVNLDQQFSKMVSSGVENVRVVFNWSSQQPYPNWQQVPDGDVAKFTNAPGDIPTDFSFSDRIIGQAAKHGISVLPVPVYAPPWDLLDTGTKVEPKRVGPYADYLVALVERYGPHGVFWSQNPQLPYLPVRRWQIWNEPNLAFFWSSRPFAPSYVALLRAAHNAIKQADPAAQVVLCGLANHSWGALGTIYRVKGSRSLFDAVAIHPYTAEPRGVITILGFVRKVMNQYGDRRKPLMVTEFGWPASVGHHRPTYGIATTAKGQARNVAAVIPLMNRARSRLGLVGFDYYTWMSNEGADANTFDFSGLFSYDPGHSALKEKPVFPAFEKAALALERCRVKASVATRCRKPS